MTQDLFKQVFICPIDATDNIAYMKWWLQVFPLDHWYRKKYNIPYGSARHIGTSIENILCEWAEEEFIKEIQQSIKEGNKRDKDWLNTPPENLLLVNAVVQEITDEQFKSMSLDDLGGLLNELEGIDL